MADNISSIVSGRVDRPYEVAALEMRNLSNEKVISHLNSQVGLGVIGCVI